MLSAKTQPFCCGFNVSKTNKFLTFLRWWIVNNKCWFFSTLYRTNANLLPQMSNLLQTKFDLCCHIFRSFARRQAFSSHQFVHRQQGLVKLGHLSDEKFIFKILDSLWPSNAIWCHVIIASGIGLLPDSTKPLPESTLTYHQWSLVALTWGWYLRKFPRYLSFIRIWKWLNHWGLATPYGNINLGQHWLR